VWCDALQTDGIGFCAEHAPIYAHLKANYQKLLDEARDNFDSLPKAAQVALSYAWVQDTLDQRRWEEHQNVLGEYLANNKQIADLKEQIRKLVIAAQHRGAKPKPYNQWVHEQRAAGANKEVTRHAWLQREDVGKQIEEGKITKPDAIFRKAWGKN
jgi:hypothetical protein